MVTRSTGRRKSNACSSRVSFGLRSNDWCASSTSRSPRPRHEDRAPAEMSTTCRGSCPASVASPNRISSVRCRRSSRRWRSTSSRLPRASFAITLDALLELGDLDRVTGFERSCRVVDHRAQLYNEPSNGRAGVVEHVRNSGPRLLPQRELGIGREQSAHVRDRHRLQSTPPPPCVPRRLLSPSASRTTDGESGATSMRTQRDAIGSSRAETISASTTNTVPGRRLFDRLQQLGFDCGLYQMEVDQDEDLAVALDARTAGLTDDRVGLLNRDVRTGSLELVQVGMPPREREIHGAVRVVGRAGGEQRCGERAGELALAAAARPDQQIGVDRRNRRRLKRGDSLVPGRPPSPTDPSCPQSSSRGRRTRVGDRSSFFIVFHGMHILFDGVELEVEAAVESPGSATWSRQASGSTAGIARPTNASTCTRARRSRRRAVRRQPATAYVLDIVGGLHAGRSFPLPRRRVVVGRAPDCDIVLDDPTVSPRHAMIDEQPPSHRSRLGQRHLDPRRSHLLRCDAGPHPHSAERTPDGPGPFNRPPRPPVPQPEPPPDEAGPARSSEGRRARVPSSVRR